MPPLQIAVIGAGKSDAALGEIAERVGAAIARRGATLICGGRSGVMEAAARGALGGGGLTVGILPSYDWQMANPHLRVVIPSGLGEARNTLVVAAAHAVIALSGEYGTLSEIGLALKLGRPVIAVQAWGHIDGVVVVDDPDAAVEAAIAAVTAR